MGFLGGGPGSGDDRGLYLYVEVEKSGEQIRVRIDPHNDLAQEFDADGGDSPTHYTCYKEVIGTQSFHPVEINLEFSRRRQLVGQEITGGRFISEDAFYADDIAPADDDGGD
ncbi:MAG TPA: hypothetical protein QGH28_04985 [Chloroflexota bacterium]|nr:hypothetical protein [Chloroflexota bacterium]